MRLPDLEKKKSDLKFKDSQAKTEVRGGGAADINLVPSTSNSNYTAPQWASADGADSAAKERSFGRTAIPLVTFLALCLIAYFNLSLIATLLKWAAPPLFGTFFLLMFTLYLLFVGPAGSKESAIRQFLVRTFGYVAVTIPVYVCAFAAVVQMGTSANTYFQQGQYEKALVVYNQLDDIYSPLYLYKENKGDCYYHLGQYQKAVDNYSITIKEDATPEVLLARAKAFKALGNRISAQKDEAAAYKLQKANTVNDLWDRHEYKEALVIYNQMVAKSPTSAKTYFMRGKCSYELKQYKNALDDFDKAMILYPKFGQALYERARTYEKLGQKKLAVKDNINAKVLGYKPVPVKTED
jgi:tetratricopeptide (TPR) repeat protein